MLSVSTGQCGLCSHFGEGHGSEPKLVQLRTSKQADEKFIETCGHPKHASLSLKVTAISSCSGFAPAKAN